ncbi:unnamed protein product [Calypogeia fissa]
MTWGGDHLLAFGAAAGCPLFPLFPAWQMGQVVPSFVLQGGGDGDKRGARARGGGGGGDDGWARVRKAAITRTATS